jgi:NhaA family Na+:H+ antiporter
MNQTASKQLDHERLAGIVLIAAAAIALIVANSPLHSAYHDLLHWKLGFSLPRIGPVTVHAFVVDGIMSIFFLLVGMEVKREWFEGRLATKEARRLPVLAAAAGMAVPAIIYLLVVGFSPAVSHGWAIPTATDIAFAIGVLAILGAHAPPSIKLLLVTIAVVDDIGAVIVIAIAYTDDINILALLAAAVVMMGMFSMSRLGVRKIGPYLGAFALLWFLVLISGIHPTIAGVLAALTVPLGPGEEKSTLEHFEHSIHPWVMFLVVPLFGFVSAGVQLSGGAGALLQPIPLAVALGLFLGKQIGVFGAIRLACLSGFCRQPIAASWPQIYGASILCGIGFTMSLFVGALAFPGNPAQTDAAKIGTFAGSLASAIVGWIVLRASSPIPFFDEDVEDAKRIFATKRRED